MRKPKKKGGHRRKKNAQQVHEFVLASSNVGPGKAARAVKTPLPVL
jgi:hypothetical protein